MRCAFPWTTTAISPDSAPQPIYSLDDSDIETIWIDANATIGSKLQFGFPQKLPSELEGTPFYGFDLANGKISPLSEFRDYSRLRKAKLFYNGAPFCYVEFADTYRWQNIFFDDIFAKHGDTFTLEILEVYPGRKFSNVALTELILQGAH